MTLQWFTPRGGQYASVSADYCYFVGVVMPDGSYNAVHRENLYRLPEVIGRAETISAAQQICEAHRAALPLSKEGS